MSNQETEKPDVDADADAEESVSAVPAAMDPVRKWTLIVIAISCLLVAWYLIADRHTPYTSQARVHALVVPIAAQVSATVTDVFVSNNQFVVEGEELFRIDPDQFVLAVETAEANLQSARQATGASAANIDAAEAALGSAIANATRAEQDVIRMRGIMEEDPGAISVRRLQAAEAQYSISKQQVTAARANVEKARQDFGDEGEQNVRILQAQAALGQARLDLERTAVRAPTDGLVTDVRVDRGNFAAVGAPQMTFLAVHNVWVQADFTENNLGNIRPGAKVEIAFDALPGKVFKGKVRSIGYGVAIDNAPLGALPTIENNRQWLRDAQRFPVLIDIDNVSSGKFAGVRVGSQAAVMIYTGDSWILNSIAWLYVRTASILSYAY
jgi:multidrug resistance efflux pump